LRRALPIYTFSVWKVRRDRVVLTRTKERTRVQTQNSRLGPNDTNRVLDQEAHQLVAVD
jgi:hypothetical protein